MEISVIRKNSITSFSLVALMILSSLSALMYVDNVRAVGNETITMVENNFDTHYDSGDVIGFGALLSGLDPDLNYEMEWRVCDIWADAAPDYSDWVDGDCVEYIGPDGNPVGGDIIVPAGVPDGYAVAATIPSTTPVDDGNGNFVDEDTLEVAQYVIAMMMATSGVSIASTSSSIFSVGDSAALAVDLAAEGDIWVNTDYTFEWKATSLHQMGSVDYRMVWEVSDLSNNMVASGVDEMATNGQCLWGHFSYSCGWYPTWHHMEDGPVISGLGVGDYVLDVWMERDQIAVDNVDFSHAFSVINAPITGLETVDVALITGGNFQYGDAVDFTWEVTGMNDDPNAIAYDFEWRVCRLINYQFSYSNDHSNWVDGDCIEEVGAASNPIINGGSSIVDNTGTSWQDQAGSSGIDQGRCSHAASGCEYVIAGMVSVNGVVVASDNTSIFSMGSETKLSLDFDRSGYIIEGNDFSFSSHIETMHEKGSVNYAVNWGLTALSGITNQGPVDVGCVGFDWCGSFNVEAMNWHGDNGQNWYARSPASNIVDISGLMNGDFDLDVWVEMDDGDGNGFVADYSQTSSVAHYFSVIGDNRATLTGTESLEIGALNSNYDIGDDIDVEIDIAGLNPIDTTYTLEWKVCKLTDGHSENNYHNSNLYNENWDLGDWVDRVCGESSWPYYMPSPALIDGDYKFNVQDGVQTFALDIEASGMGVGEYIIAAVLNVSAAGSEAIVATANSDYFSVGSAASADVDLERSGNILADMDYNFEFGANGIFFLSDLDYTITWVVRNDLTGVSAGFGSYTCTSTDWFQCDMQSASVPSTMLSFGDYTLYVWIERDGVSDPSIDAEFEHNFRVINPALNTLATVDVEVDSSPTGWGYATIYAYDLDNGQYFTIEWSVTDMMNNVVDDGEETWIAPPDTKNFVFDFDHISNGNYCITANLYAAQILVHTQNDCWTQATTEDDDGDGVLNPDDMCPYDPVVANDVNGDGCEDVDDTDGDGMDDDWENYWGTDMYVDDSADDMESDGLTNLQEFTAGTNPLAADSDGDGVGDGTDACPMQWGDGVDGCLVPINLPPTCDVYYSLESNGMVVSGSAAIMAIPPTIPGGLPPMQISIPPGDYYIIAVCSDPDGDLVTATVNGVVVGPQSEAIAGAMISIDETAAGSSVDVTLGWTDGTNTMAATITVVIDNSGNYTPGFTSVLSLVALLGAALILQRRRL